MSNGIETLSYSDITQATGPENIWLLRANNDLNFLLLGFILAVLIVLYKGIKDPLKRIQ